MKIDKEILFIIIVPVYKVEDYIRECVDSVLNQTYQNFKLILVDDGSPDDSGSICDKYAKSDNRITVIHQNNLGQIAARLAAIRFIQSLQLSNTDSQSAYVIHLDSDDSIKEHTLKMIYKTIISYDCDMVIYGFERVYQCESISKYKKPDEFCGLVESKRELYKLVFNDSDYNSVWRKAVSINLISEIDYSKYYNIRYGEDLIQSIAYYQKACRVYFINESLYNYTVNPNSVTQTISVNDFKIDFTVRELVSKFLESENVFTKDDWKQYTSFCIKQIFDSIYTIIGLSIPDNMKRKYFEEIYYSNYFQNHIKGRPYYSKALGVTVYVTYFLFNKKCYGLILYITKYWLSAIKKAHKILKRDKI